MKRIAIFFFVLLSSVYSFANVELYCKANVEACIQRSVFALQNMNCRLSEVNCEEMDVEGETRMICLAVSENCYEPSPELFGITSSATKCFGAKKKGLKNSLTLTWTMGLLGGYVRDVCVAE